MKNIVKFETKIPLLVPGSDEIVKATVTSDVYEGLTIALDPGASMYMLHEQILDGLIHAVSFTAVPAKKAE